MQKYRVVRHEVTQPLDQSIKLIPLTKGQNAIVDAEDYDFLMQWNWYASFVESMGSYYAARTSDIGVPVYMHRFLISATNPIVDHRNLNTLDNRRDNLREGTKAQNASNCEKYKTNNSGYKGVHWCEQKQKWVAKAQHNKNRFYLGSFESAELAHEAYSAFVANMKGEFSRD